MNRHISIQLHFKGGIVSTGSLAELLELASQSRISQLRFGSRQQMMMDLPAQKAPFFEAACKEIGIPCYRLGRMESAPNVCSSYPATGLFVEENWLKEGIYKDLFDAMDFQPKLKINLSDGSQSMFPLLSGHLNWISSTKPHFWYLYIRMPGSRDVYCWPSMVYTNDLINLSKNLDHLLAQARNKDTDSFLKMLSTFSEQLGAEGIRPEKEYGFPRFSLPYYEGFNKHGDRLWLGIYRRDEHFPLAFLKDLCRICQETQMAELYTSPWKSLIVKGIHAEHRSLWDHILGKYRINVRHAANELNWQVGDHDDDSLALKHYIIRQFDKEDVRSYGLCFALQPKPNSYVFGSVLIRTHRNRGSRQTKSLERYDILHTRDFNPHTRELILFREKVEKQHLGTYLVSLCKLFYENESRQDMLKEFGTAKRAAEIHEGHSDRLLQQCSRCLSIYDEQFGEPSQNIVPETPFEKLPVSYHCPVCGAGIPFFRTVSENTLYKSTANE